MLIRPAREEDNEQLKQLEASAIQGEKLQLVTEREDYFFRAKKFNDPLLYVAEEEGTGNIQAVMGVGPVRTNFNGALKWGGYIFDLRANPRNKGLNRAVFRIWQVVREEIKKRELDFIFGFVKEDNFRSLNIMRKAGAEEVGEKVFYVLPVHKAWTKSVEKGKLIKEFDIDKEYTEYKNRWEHRNFFPVYEDLKNLKENYSNYLYGMVACNASSLKIWDTSFTYGYRVIKVPPVFNFMRPFFKGLSPFFSLPSIPSPGEKIKNWFLFDLNLSEKEDLPCLLEYTRQKARENEIDFLIYVRDKNDPGYSFLEKQAWLKFNYKAIFMPINDLPSPEGSCYYDVTFL